MRSGMAQAYSTALDNFSNQANRMVDREDRLKQQKIENDRWNTTNQRAEESHAATMENINLQTESAQRKLDHDKELEDITPALIAKERGGVQGAIDYLTQNPQIVEKYKSTLLPHYTKEQLLEHANTTTQVADFVGSLTSKDKLSGIFQGSPLQERMKVFKEEDLRNQYGISGKDFAAFSATADPLGSPRTKAEVFDTGDGFKGQYALNDKGTPMISGIGLTRDGGIAPVYKINKLDAAGNIVGSYDAPATEGRSLDPNAPVIFRTAQDFKDRADAQQLAVIATQMENRKIALDPTYAKEVLHGIKTQKNDTAIAAQAEPIIKKLSALKGTATEKEAASLEIFKTASPAVMAYLKTVIDLPGKAFEAQGKREDTKTKAEEDRALRRENNIRDNETRKGMAANRTSGDGSLTQKQKAELTRLDHEYSRLSISYDASAKRLVDNPGEQARLDKISAQMDENKRRTEEVLGYDKPAPAAGGITGNGKQSPIPPKGQQPKTPAGLNSFFN